MNNFNYYDIESLENIFTIANYREKENDLEIYFLFDNLEILAQNPGWRSQLTKEIYNKNKNYNGTIHYYDLLTTAGAQHLAMTFGACSAQKLIRSRKEAVKREKYLYGLYEQLEKAEAKGLDLFADEVRGKIENEESMRKYHNGEWTQQLRLIADTDVDYDPEIHPFFLGYNSNNYDTSMLAIYICHILRQAASSGSKSLKTIVVPRDPDTKKPVITASELRGHSDAMFFKYKKSMPQYLANIDDDKYQSRYWRVRKNMLLSGRYLDVARLNEKQSRVKLKRLLGMEGLQILESEKLKGNTRINTIQEFYDLIAYNVSDVVNLKELFYNKVYMSQFELKRDMLQNYPELIYQQSRQKVYNENGQLVYRYAPELDPDKRLVKPDRLCIDSSSAQFATQCLCPYGNLDDFETVSYLYPSERKAKELGIPRVNVLEETKKFFYNLYPQEELRRQFDQIYQFYKSIEGKNLNDSKHYHDQYPNNEVFDKAKIPLTNNCIPYFDKDGNPTSCYVQFSIGGIHGAEYNQALFNADMADWLDEKALFEEVQSLYPDPVALRKAKTVTLSNGETYEYKRFLKSGKKIADSEYRDIQKTIPQLFTLTKTQSKTGEKQTYKLNPKYVYTSADESNHEDFTSYYPCLLMAMEAFMNTGLGYDRYEEIFNLKQKYGKLMKDETVPKEQRDKYKIQREGTKLVLNSASGVADGRSENNIRVNNKIVSMRIIGQLFTWRIGQAQTYQGAKITSTNTDGLYSVMEATLNNKILEKEAQDIGIGIEPEPMYLISKDTNNRIEMTDPKGKILSASGGTLGCMNGPTPTKALAHPAIIDWALAKYLIKAANQEDGTSLTKGFNDQVGQEILDSAKEEFSDFEYLRMYQNILAPSSSGAVNVIYATTKPNDETEEPLILQDVNRVFMMKDDTPDTIYLKAATGRKVTPAMLKKRIKAREEDPTLLLTDRREIPSFVLKRNGVYDDVPEDYDIVSKKITNLEPTTPVFIQNKNLHILEQSEIDFIINNLNIDCYLDLLKHAFEENWMNKAA